MAHGRGINERKDALFVGIAQRALDAGDAVRAVSTVLSGLRKYPQLCQQPSPLVDILAHALLRPGLEEELVDCLDSCDPRGGFVAALVQRLRQLDKVEVARGIESAFSRRHPEEGIAGADIRFTFSAPTEQAASTHRRRPGRRFVRVDEIHPPSTQCVAFRPPPRELLELDENPVTTRAAHQEALLSEVAHELAEPIVAPMPSIVAAAAGMSRRQYQMLIALALLCASVAFAYVASLSPQPQNLLASALVNERSTSPLPSLNQPERSKQVRALSEWRRRSKPGTARLVLQELGERGQAPNRQEVSEARNESASVAGASNAPAQRCEGLESANECKTGTGQAPNRQEIGRAGQAPNRQEIGRAGQAPNRQEIGGTGQAPNRQKTLNRNICTDAERCTAGFLQALLANELGLADSFLKHPIWNTHPESYAWLLGLREIEAGRVLEASKALDEACASGNLLALLDLAQLALSTREPHACAIFSKHAPSLANAHPFIPVAQALLKRNLGRPEAIELDWPKLDELSLEQRAWVQLAQALNALHADHDELAEAILSRALSENPAQPELNFVLGMLLIEHGQSQRAAALLAAALDELPPAAEPAQHAELALQRLWQQGHPEAMVLLLDSTEGPSVWRPSTRRWRIKAEVALGNCDEARKQLPTIEDTATLAWAEQRLELACPSELRTRRQLGPASSVEAELAAWYAALNEHNPSAALDELQRISTAYPLDHEALELQAELLGLMGRVEDATTLLNTRLASSPRQHILSTLQRCRSGCDDAVAVETALGFETCAIELLAAQTELAFRFGAAQRAATLLQTLLERAPQYPRAQALAGLFAPLEEKQRLDALSHGRQGALTLPGLHLAWGTALFADGQEDAGLRALTEGLSTASSQPELVQAMAEHFLESRQLLRGQRQLRALLSQIPSLPNTQTLRGHLSYWAGVLILQQEKPGAAGSLLEQARVLLGEEPLVLYRLAEYHRKRGHQQAAKRLGEELENLQADFDPKRARLGQRSQG
ncbi:MAG: hypothetical protein RBU37_02085 [Myxococcota bacterium]|jgi:predicted Zn-dependent protease|nr:hypothetical protein [Myxococcota bacterium]